MSVRTLVDAHCTHKVLISSSYNLTVAFLLTVPFPARSMGFSRDVTRIISLKILLNAGASLFASSTSGLQGHLKLDNIISSCTDLPDLIPELGKLSLIINIDFVG